MAPEHRPAFQEGAVELARRFLDSPLGRLAAAREREVELPLLPVIFLLRSGEALPVRRSFDWPALFAALPR